MTILLILIGSIIAVSAIVAFNVWIGGWTASRIESVDEASRILRQDLVTFEPGSSGILATDGLACLVSANDGKYIGYLSARGAGHVSRLINPGMVTRTSIEDGGVIVLRFKDFTFPSARITLGDEAAAREWAARLNGDTV